LYTGRGTPPRPDICTPNVEESMTESISPRSVSLGRQYSELDYLLCKLNDAIRVAESVETRGVSADVDLMSVTEALRGARATVRHAIDETGRLIDAESEGGE
jgi:hypothetical protein